MINYAIYLAGLILVCITSANLFAPRMMRWTANLDKTEQVFRQVFIVHCVFLLACVMGMALLCFIKPEWLVDDGLGHAVAGFMALFWGLRFLVQCFYYEKSIKRQYPFFNVLFILAFAYLTILFGMIFIRGNLT